MLQSVVKRWSCRSRISTTRWKESFILSGKARSRSTGTGGRTRRGKAISARPASIWGPTDTPLRTRSYSLCLCFHVWCQCPSLQMVMFTMILVMSQNNCKYHYGICVPEEQGNISEKVKVFVWVQPRPLISQIKLRIMCQSRQNFDCNLQRYHCLPNRTEKLERKQRDGLRSTTRTSSPPATAPLTSPMLTSHWRSSSTLLVIQSRKNPERSVTKRSNWRGFRRRREEIIRTLQSWRRRRILLNPSQAVYLGGRLEGRRKVPWRWLELRSPGTKSPLLLPPLHCHNHNFFLQICLLTKLAFAFF